MSKEEIKVDETAEKTAVSENGNEEIVAEDIAEDEATEGTEDEATEGAEETEDVPKRLVAIYPILYLSHQYQVSETLPANNPDMVEAWLAAGTAVWVDDKQAETPAKAQPATAEPGLPGVSVSSESEDGEDLVGKVPKTGRRSKK